MKHIALITPEISSLNLGDTILFDHIYDEMSKLFPDYFLIKIPAYNLFDERSEYIMNKCEFAIFCGTGMLRNELAFHWSIKKGDFKNNVVLLGCGWNRYEDSPINKSTAKLYESVLSKEYVHSVRDDYTADKLEQLSGIDSINTSCPTMWNINTDKIKKRKSKNALFTVNAVRSNYYGDRSILKMLNRNYDNVYFFPQSPYDYDYAKGLDCELNYLSGNTNSLYKFVNTVNFDYIGSRLHCGIHCLANDKRSIIVAVDNRAAEISKNTGLPVMEYDAEQIEEEIYNPTEIEITLPTKAIKEWKEQFNG